MAGLCSPPVGLRWLPWLEGFEPLEDAMVLISRVFSRARRFKASVILMYEFELDVVAKSIFHDPVEFLIDVENLDTNCTLLG